ncbi:MAG: hypothetical protein FWG48_01930 [Oscillospiraceae bacterium]|nr:hypothetical protein [Oscillospiraceae bacterium]
MAQTMKTLARSPVRTILSIVLLGVIAFTLLSQAEEYAITRREVANAAAQYYGVGSVEDEPPYAPPGARAGIPQHLALDSTAIGWYVHLTQEQIDAAVNLPYISSTDVRYMTAGISDKYRRMDDGDYFYPFHMRCVVEATVISEGVHQPYGYSSFTSLFYVDDARMLAGHVPQDGDKPTIETGGKHSAHALNGTTKSLSRPLGGSYRHDGESNRAGWYTTIAGDYGANHISNLAVGNKYVFVLRVAPRIAPGEYFYHIGDMYSDSWCDAVWPLDGEPENYLELEKFSPLRELIEITDADSRTFDMVYTEDMKSIMRFADGRMELLEGRMLTPEDSRNDVQACVVSYEFASENGLGIGDTVTFGLGTVLFEQYLNLGAIAGTPARYEPPQKEAELEIVGIYINTDGLAKRSKDPHWGYSINAVFVPRSLLPADEAALGAHEFTPSEFSFRVDDVRDIQAFLDAATPAMADIGLSLVFYDRGWLAIESGFEESAWVSRVKILLFSLAVAAATVLAAYLFIGRRRKDYAIMRALGTPKAKAGGALAYPLIAVTVVSLLIGGTASILYTRHTVARNNALLLLEEYAVDASAPMAVVIGASLGQLLFTIAFALATLRRMGSRPPLSLLQGSA